MQRLLVRRLLLVAALLGCTLIVMGERPLLDRMGSMLTN